MSENVQSLACVWVYLYPEQMIRIHLESENSDLAGEEQSRPYVNQILRELAKMEIDGNRRPDFFKKRRYVIFSMETDLAFNAAARSVSELTKEFKGYVHSSSTHADHKCIIDADGALLTSIPLLDLYSIRMSVLEDLVLNRDKCSKEPRDSALQVLEELKKVKLKTIRKSKGI